MSLKEIIGAFSVVLLLAVTLVFFKKNNRQGSILFFFSIPLFFELPHVFNDNGIYIEGFISKLSYLVFPLVFFLWPVRLERKVKNILGVFVLVNTFLAIVCFFYAFYKQFRTFGFEEINWYFFSYHDFTRVIGIHPTYFSLFLGFAILILFHYSILKGKRIVPGILLMIFLFTIQVMLTSRTPLVITLLLLVINIFLHFSLKKALLYLSVIMVLTTVVIANHSIVKTRLESTFMGLKKGTKIAQHWGEESGKFTDRKYKWRGALQLISKHPWIGVGSEKMKDELVEEYKKLNYEIGIDNRYDPHNQLLTMMASYGVLAGFFYLIMYGIPMIITLIDRNYLYFSFLVMVFGAGITESVLLRQRGLVFYTFFNSLFVSYYLFKKQQNSLG